MDQLAVHLGIARAEDVDRGVVNVNIQQKQVSDGNDDKGASQQTGGGDLKVGNPVAATTTTTTSQALFGNKPTASASVTSTADSGNNGVSGVSELPSVSSSTIADSAASETSKAPKSGSGIGTGAIVGIVVGVVGGLLLIAAVAFFLLRKRRQKKTEAGYDGSDPANTYMVDKETQGRATDSPNSPYTDENQTRSMPLDNVARDDPAHGGLPRTSTSLSQGRSAGAQTPQGMSSNVAHLVEDGMTAEEIRRLEEEERQLDDEIERAARR